MRRYIYLSQRKVEVLHSQLPLGIRDLGRRMKLKFGPIELSGDGDPAEAVVQKLARVEAFLRRRGLTRDLEVLEEEPEAMGGVQYFSGSLPLSYNIFQGGDWPFNESWAGMSLLYFSGSSERLLVGLGAGPDGLVHRAEQPLRGEVTGSDPGFLLRALAKFDSHFATKDPAGTGAHDFQASARAEHVDSIVDSMATLAEQRSPRIRAHFVAQLIHVERRGAVTAVLGTPLFVAHVVET